MLENKLFKFEEGVVSRWASYENPDGAKGAGGTVEHHARDHARRRPQGDPGLRFFCRGRP